MKEKKITWLKSHAPCIKWESDGQKCLKRKISPTPYPKGQKQNPTQPPCPHHPIHKSYQVLKLSYSKQKW